ncbi:MAG: hypothetical protein Q9162_002143 [Coniocarpon cinnabarinum]
MDTPKQGSKRKQAPNNASSSRPTKIHRTRGREKVDHVPQHGNKEVIASEPDHSPENKVDTPGRRHFVMDDQQWQATIEKAIPNVVSIRFCTTAAFDTEEAGTSEATGFVVDAKRGLILTNRHVVNPGPFWGFCVFENHEETDVWPVYRDPVHDFGFLKFNPRKVEYMQLSELQIRPDKAQVGTEFRMVGNDAGEKLSIHSGVVSRLDRNAPEYHEGYCDFNTNYIQAAAAATGGSSGSPIVNLDGHAIAMQAGGRNDAATDYFLPLDRPRRALECLQKQQPITRGTIQAQWLIKPFDECKRLGLSKKWENYIRKEFPKETGLLVAEVVLPEGPAHHSIEEGDILMSVNDEPLTKFVRLDEILDSMVGQEIELMVQRGGEDIKVKISVQDLHAITPDRMIQVAGGSFHTTSYQQARLYGIACKGVFVCDAVGAFRLEPGAAGYLITSIDHQETPDLETFIEVMKNVPDRARVAIQYKYLADMHTLNTIIVQVDRHWFRKMRMAIRNDETGFWDFKDLADALPPNQPTSGRATFPMPKGEKNLVTSEMLRSFVRVSTSLPVKLDGFPKTRKVGHGLVVDADKGLVVVSRAIIPYDLCDISVTIAESLIVEASVVFMHPLLNFSIIQYDPKLVEAPVQSAKLSEYHVDQGDECIFFAFNHNLRHVKAKTSVTDVSSVSVPASQSTPRYRAVNMEAVTIDSGLSQQCGTGALVTEDATVLALWMSHLGERNCHGRDTEYHLGLPSPCIIPVVRQLQAGTVPNLNIVNAEFTTSHISQVRTMGLSEAWIQRVEAEDPEHHQLFMVRKVDSDLPVVDGDRLAESDTLLTLNGKLITQNRDFEIQYDADFLDAVVLRKGKEKHLKVKTVSTADLNTSRAVSFAGAILQPPHHAVRQQISKLHSHIYIGAKSHGSPADMYGLAPTNFIIGVNGTSVDNLDEFLKEIGKVGDNTYFRLKMMSFDDVPFVVTMKKCEHYFPTLEWRKDSVGKWERREVEGHSGEGFEGEAMQTDALPFGEE